MNLKFIIVIRKCRGITKENNLGNFILNVALKKKKERLVVETHLIVDCVPWVPLNC